MSAVLDVALFGIPAGQLWLEGANTAPEDWRFVYLPDYLARPTKLALSASLPLRDEPFIGAVVRNWFCNLLPEGSVRDAITDRLRLPRRDDFGLLAAIGGECAGAVSIRGMATAGPAEESETDDLEALLFLQGDYVGEGTWALAGTPKRLSLAGAQDKIPVIRDPDGRLRVPTDGEPSTHILKPDSRRFPGLRDLEALGLRLAAAVGLDVAAARLVDVADRSALLIERYDRIGSPGAIARLHQEDFCQALGYPGELKYEKEGGPSLAACSHLIRDLALGPVGLQHLLDWVLFNVLIGNADAHAKNLSLLYGTDGQCRVAPYYDLVPTLVLPATLVERAPALRLGAAKDIATIRASDWRDFAQAARYAPSFVLRRVRQLAERLQEALRDTVLELIAEGGDEKRLGDAMTILSAHMRQTAIHAVVHHA